MLFTIAGGLFSVSAATIDSPYLIVDEEFFIEPGGDLADPVPDVNGVTYDPDTYTLTLDGYDGKTICSHGFNLKIVVKGENTVTAADIELGGDDSLINPGGAINVGLNSGDDNKPYSVAISGSGTLDVIGGGGYGISGKTSISGATVNISIDEAESFGIDTHGTALDITGNAKVTVMATGDGSQAVLASQVNTYAGAVLKEGASAASAKEVTTLATAEGVGEKYFSIMPVVEEEKEESTWEGPKTGDNTLWTVIGMTAILFVSSGLLIMVNRKKVEQV